MTRVGDQDKAGDDQLAQVDWDADVGDDRVRREVQISPDIHEELATDGK